MTLYHEIYRLTHAYTRKGGKDNRRQQRRRMLAFARHAQNMGAKSIGQVGCRHVKSYWKYHRDLSESTKYNHWLAIRELWKISGKVGIPPKFLSKSNNDLTSEWVDILCE